MAIYDDALPRPDLITQSPSLDIGRPDYVEPKEAYDLVEHGSDEFDSALRLHAAVYMREGYIEADEIDDDGYIVEGVDPYRQRSDYFYTVDEDVDFVGTCRQIRCDRKDGIASLPTLSHFRIMPDKLLGVAGADKLADIKPKEVVEISALATANMEGGKAYNHEKTVELYASMLRRSVDEGHKIWVMSTDSRLTEILNDMMGGHFVPIGESADYIGSRSDPGAMNVEDLLRYFLSSDADSLYRDTLISKLDGIDTSLLPEDIAETIEASGIETVKINGVVKYLKKPEVIASAALAAYAAARAVPLAAVEEFSGNPYVFGAIDIGTAPTYAFGLKWLYSSRSETATKAKGAIVASASFAAPYAYVYANGENYPVAVNAVIGGFVLGGVAKEVITRKRKSKKESTLETALVNVV